MEPPRAWAELSAYVSSVPLASPFYAAITGSGLTRQQSSAAAWTAVMRSLFLAVTMTHGTLSRWGGPLLSVLDVAEGAGKCSRKCGEDDHGTGGGVGTGMRPDMGAEGKWYQRAGSVLAPEGWKSCMETRVKGFFGGAWTHRNTGRNMRRPRKEWANRKKREGKGHREYGPN